ncbi:MAG: lysophospholipid acyltransferase family protein [Betaproteobacteria bacterium]
MRIPDATIGESILGAASIPAGEGTYHLLPVPARIWRMLRIAMLLLLFALFTAGVTAFAAVRRRERFIRWWAGMVLRALGVRLICDRSPVIEAGPALLVANHVSSIDSILICAVQPACFVAKSELGNSAWLRWLLAEAGTIFVDRGKRDDVLRTLAAMHEALDAGERVALFPEATISPNSETRPFNSALLEPACDGVPVYFFALSLTRADGTPCLEADFPLGQSFLASFWRLTAAPGMVARIVVLGPFDFSGANRKRIANFAHDTIHSVLSGSAAAPVLRKPAPYAAR